MDATDLLSARRYAQAVQEIAVEAGTVETWSNDLNLLARIWKETRIVRTLDDPKVGQTRRMAEARQRLGAHVSPLALNLVLLLIKKGRAGLVPRIADAFERLENDRSARITAQVTSAIPLTDEQRASLVEQLGQRTGRTVMLDERVNEDILGGLIVRVGDELIDASVAGRLRRIEAQLRS